MCDDIPVTPEEEAAWREMERRQAAEAAKAAASAPVDDEPRWYAVSRCGEATLCIDEPDAIMEAATAALAFPNNAPYRAVQLVELVEPTRGEPSATAGAHPAGVPVLYQHDDGRYGLSLGPAQFAVGEPAWHHVPIDVVEQVGGGQTAATGPVQVKTRQTPVGLEIAVWQDGQCVYCDVEPAAGTVPADAWAIRDSALEEAAQACERQERIRDRKDAQAVCRLCARDIRALKGNSHE